ncbi:PREDICTED: LOW QUALITY PROTEIN: mediator of RNA polymerase II transcription subunit 9-like [Branchiostoma belcheri]|uniref:Mediator of RNA polymerase II transcription subunit 9 n=1 Tax=Branchiostoma belcheri TaxID=7741 RepID=A0A6P4XUD4_BRABE|nr:PREDICTED: LOW QUALITY PROTEIN: mediator of RNA polymerase II transcription subunit 9-like [Branchiostoma belcheri]
MASQAGTGNDMSFLPLVHEIIRGMDMESPDVNQKITELKTKFQKCRTMVEEMPGIDCSEEEQKQQIEQLRQQVTTKTDLLKKYKNLCAFECQDHDN